MFRTFACSTAFAVLLLLTPQAQTATTIRIWKVGSPHSGDTPHTELPPALAREAGSRGWRLSIEAFPAQGFAGRFFAAVRDGSAPDLLVFDNFGIVEGITTDLGTFIGIGQDPVTRKQLIQVTRSFDELLGPARGWTFLVTSSANHAAARALALRPPRCADASSAQSLPADLAVAEVAAAYLAGDSAGILRHADPERLTGLRREPGAGHRRRRRRVRWMGERTARLRDGQRLVSGGHHDRSRVPAARVPQDLVALATARGDARSGLESSVRDAAARVLQDAGPRHPGRPRADARHVALT